MGLGFVPFWILRGLRNDEPTGVQVLYDLRDTPRSASLVRRNRRLPLLPLQKPSVRTPLRQMRIPSGEFRILACNVSMFPWVLLTRQLIVLSAASLN